MKKSFLKILGLISISIFLFVGCGDEKTVVTTVHKDSKVDKNVEPIKTVKIKTH